MFYNQNRLLIIKTAFVRTENTIILFVISILLKQLNYFVSNTVSSIIQISLYHRCMHTIVCDDSDSREIIKIEQNYTNNIAQDACIILDSERNELFTTIFIICFCFLRTVKVLRNLRMTLISRKNVVRILFCI